MRPERSMQFHLTPSQSYRLPKIFLIPSSLSASLNTIRSLRKPFKVAPSSAFRPISWVDINKLKTIYQLRLHTLRCHSCTVKVEVNFVACAVPHCSYMVPSINWRGCAEKKLFCDNRKLHSSLYASCENSKGATGHAIRNLKKVKIFNIFSVYQISDE